MVGYEWKRQIHSSKSWCGRLKDWCCAQSVEEGKKNGIYCTLKIKWTEKASERRSQVGWVLKFRVLILTISHKRALGWRWVIRTQEWMQIKDAISKAQKRALGLYPSKWCLFLSWYFFFYTHGSFLSLGLFHSNSKDPKGHLAQIPASNEISLEFKQITWTCFVERFSPLSRTFVSQTFRFLVTDCMLLQQPQSFVFTGLSLSLAIRV